MLTKSSYLKFLQCPRYAWLWEHKKNEMKQPLSLGDEWAIEEGRHVEEIARESFSKGVHVKSFHEAGAKQTSEFMKKGFQCLFQATAIGDGLLAMADILQFDSKRKAWDIYEVKSTTQVKDEHLHDVCFQRLAFERAGYKIGKTFVIHINNEYVLGEKLDPSGLLTVDDVTDDVREIEDDVSGRITQAKVLLARSSEPTPTEVPCECSPKNGPCPEHCFPNLPDHSVYYLRGMTAKKAKLLYESGIRTVDAVPDGTKFNEAQQLQVLSAKRGEPIFDHAAIRKELDSLTYPLYFFDYETFSATVPLFEGFKPGQVMPFQYSLHVQRVPGGEFEHYEYLAPAFGNTIPGLIASLRSHIGENGSVIVWHKSFEMTRNDEMGVLYPADAPFLTSINDRIFDLKEIFSNLHYVDARFDGSCSIKNVLPVLIPTLSHKDLDISEGMTASLSWYRMFGPGKMQQEQEQTRKNLLEYCELDTFAMVEIFRLLCAL